MPSSPQEKYRYILTMDPPTADLGYWKDGIKTVCEGNDQMRSAAEKQWKGSVRTLIDERRAMMDNMIGAGVPLIVLPYPTGLVRKGDVTQDVEYVRDPFIVSRKTGNALLFDMAEPTRKKERDFLRPILEAMNIPVYQSTRGSNEGGNSRRFDLNGDTWLFSSTSVRSQADAIREMADFLDIPPEKRALLDINPKSSFHLDCVMTGAVDHDREIIAFFGLMSALAAKARERMEEVLRELEAPFYNITPEDAEQLATNSLQVGDHFFASSPFTSTENRDALEGMASVHLSPLSQNLHTGGAVHCLTNEIYTDKPLDEDAINKRLKRHADQLGFESGARVRIFNPPA